MKKKKEEQKDTLLTSCFWKERTRNNPFTVANYNSGMGAVRNFLGEEWGTFEVSDVTSTWVARYLSYLRDNDALSEGSMDCYMRILRAVYNRAVREGVIEATPLNPFKGITISVPATAKRSLSEAEMETIIFADLSANGRLSFARDLFLFLFYARGMCFVDVFNLTYREVSGGYIRYKRSKTGVPLCVKIEPELQELMDKYKEEDSPYLFPTLRRHCYKKGHEISEPTAIRRINRQLDALGEHLGLGNHLTAYVARHTWASFAEASGMNTPLISQGLGHSSERVTRRYMKGIPSYIMDGANKMMFEKMIRGGEKEKCPILCKNETSANLLVFSLLKNKGYLPANVWIIII